MLFRRRLRRRNNIENKLRRKGGTTAFVDVVTMSDIDVVPTSRTEVETTFVLKLSRRHLLTLCRRRIMKLSRRQVPMSSDAGYRHRNNVENTFDLKVGSTSGVDVVSSREPTSTYLYIFTNVLFPSCSGFFLYYLSISYICDNYIPIKHVIYRQSTIITKQTPYIVIIYYDYILNIITCNILCGMSWSNILFILIFYFR